jgi:hypothetical protein
MKGSTLVLTILRKKTLKAKKPKKGKKLKNTSSSVVCKYLEVVKTARREIGITSFNCIKQRKKL